MRFSKFLRTLAVAALPFLVATPSVALTGPALVISDGTNSVTIDSTGTPIYSGSATGTVTFGSGEIMWNGMVGTFSLQSVQFRTKPLLSTAYAGNIDVGSAIVGAMGPGGTITITWSDTGFYGLGAVKLNHTTSSVAGNASVTYTGYANSSNALLAVTNPVVSVGPIAIAPGMGNNTAVTGSGPFIEPYSLTLVESITLDSGAGIQNDVQLLSTPLPPVISACGVFAGTVGSPITPITLTASGGAGGPYTFAAMGLPDGLNISSSGTISGTPASGGTFHYSVVVTDTATGETGTSNCTVTIMNPATNPPPTTPVGHGDAATIGFWHNQNGQYIISILNGGGTSTALANWLATQFTYLYGAQSANNLTNKTNAAVASLFMTFFNVKGSKTNAQILGGALATYVTSTSLSGTGAAITAARTSFGFNSSTAGTGAKTYNVGSLGTALGLTNNTSYTVLQLLNQANLTKQNGTFNASAWNTIFDGINSSGDIIG